MPPKFEVRGKENFPTIQDETSARNGKEARKNVGWQHGLRGEDLTDFIETAMAKEAKPCPHSHQEAPQKSKIEPQDLLNFLYNDIEKTREKVERLEEKEKAEKIV
ncbi:hypothetical protein COX74_03505 [bacterium (Candidatus Gribaldobacteria) CG_4_10_14_0_2_um_filter_41_16]|uniref:Uncharacterized protein n=3 Tax=Candidatus Gribaldobacteria TaxID=2798536 RepID=A0A2M7VHH4_9BACT|nr:MAG: hypothetical protein AUJ36_00405 [Parcubacteria group bacterium CG1_02_41_26]PIR91654.1 MAG: hypothetical protein COU03_01235 [bacterium (Candidatus Gribaldobacteria) CG10_big_fil_rev_8_21_14_0_10_41_12]PIV47193.1 MAG: hypothetical protein COS21_01315 [bacterium (Candidatus Gribaldobacteria) CG02_land_8_20_14_3_00_41_15]PJA01214.1 MAG: hypothetical protein COX74_03505 [bacterium (Candidatus Gribaldobacteria) CG_4_10_14_0_2_um_filter_41_16]